MDRLTDPSTVWSGNAAADPCAMLDALLAGTVDCWPTAWLVVGAYPAAPFFEWEFRLSHWQRVLPFELGIYYREAGFYCYRADFRYRKFGIRLALGELALRELDLGELDMKKTVLRKAILHSTPVSSEQRRFAAEMRKDGFFGSS